MNNSLRNKTEVAHHKGYTCDKPDSFHFRSNYHFSFACGWMYSAAASGSGSEANDRNSHTSTDNDYSAVRNCTGSCNSHHGRQHFCNQHYRNHNNPCNGSYHETTHNR